MNRKSSAYSKITRPDVSGISPRSRLFSLIDKSAQPVIWISGPGGSGKTTLVASYIHSLGLNDIWYHVDAGDADPATFFHYMGMANEIAFGTRKNLLPSMTPEYLALGISSFSRKYFDTVFSNIAQNISGKNLGLSYRPFVFVLDNYQDLPSDAMLNEVLSSGLSVLPDLIRVIIISRNAAPPSSFSSLMEAGKIRLIGWEDVRFTLEESRSVISSDLKQWLIEKIIRDVHAKAHGWVAGMILMLEKSRIDGFNLEMTDDQKNEIVFDSIANDIIGRSGAEIQNFLLKTSFLPEINPLTARQLTDLENSDQILSLLHNQHFFTEKLSGSACVYKYHNLFRRFLNKKACEEFSEGELSSILKHSAAMLEKDNQIEDAVRLYADSESWSDVLRIVKSHSRDFLMQGRNRTIGEWIERIPDDISINDPWIAYWKGMSLFPYDIPHTRYFLELSLEGFLKESDVSGIYLSWAGIVDTYAFELDEWRNLDRYIDKLDRIIEEFPEMPSVDIDLVASSRMLIALTLRKTDHPEWVNEWFERVSELLRKKTSIDIAMDTTFCMSVYYLWTGEYYKNGILLEKADAEANIRNLAPFTSIRIKLMRGIHFWVTAKYGQAADMLSEGLDISDNCGIHVFDSLLWSFIAASELAQGYLEKASASVKKQLNSLVDKSKTLDLFFYHVNTSWHAVLSGNISLAYENLSAVSGEASGIGAPYYSGLWKICMSQVKYMQGHRNDAINLVSEAVEISVGMRSKALEWYSNLIKSYFLFDSGDDEVARELLSRSFSIGSRNGFVHLEFYQPEYMKLLCSRSIKHGIEVDYAKDLINKLKLDPPSFAALPTDWPWNVMVFTLGRFEIIVNGKPLVFSGKEPRKPLEMLKAIIAFGGRNVPEDKIADVLWPDSDGDRAIKSLETTLMRLRRILGGDHYIRYFSGQLDLDSSCWVDSLALAGFFSKIAKRNENDSLNICRKAISLYSGQFLPSDSDLFFVMSRREMLKNDFVKVIAMSARIHELKGDWESAAELYQHGLHSDDLSEEFYRRLMICYHKSGKPSEAVKLFKRCEQVLKINLGISPSNETLSVLSSIMDNK